jgi:MFS-type transporter involved in bile tolerance (Atg22 family)
MFWKIFFWISIICLAFVNPLISFGLLILYYLPGIVRSLGKEFAQGANDSVKPDLTSEQKEDITAQYSTPEHSMDKFSDDTLENMR